MNQPKFQIGQKVKFQGDNDSEAGVVQSFSYNPDAGWMYTISARALDFQAKQVIEGVKHCREDEFVDMPAASQPQPTQTPQPETQGGQTA